MANTTCIWINHKRCLPPWMIFCDRNPTLWLFPLNGLLLSSTGVIEPHACLASYVWAVKNIAFDVTHHVHFARFAIKLQGKCCALVDQLHGFHLGTHTRDAFGLLGAKFESKA